MPSDDFGPPLYEPVADEPRKGRRLARAVLAGIAVAGLLAIVWHAYDLGRKSSSDNETPPLVQADEGPAKVRPDEPGGMEVPDQDKLVYNRINPESADKSGEAVEHLLPMPEKPVTPPVAQAPEAAPAPEAKPQTAAGAAPAAQSAPPSTSPSSTAPSAAPNAALKETPKAAAKEAANEVPRKEAKIASAPPAQKSALSPSASGGYRIQLGAVRSSEAAEKEWTALVAKYHDILGNLTLRVQPVNLPEKGTYYRIQGGSFADAAEAKRACEALAASKQGCLVVAP